MPLSARAAHTLEHIGPAILHGAVTTFLVFFVLVFGRSLNAFFAVSTHAVNKALMQNKSIYLLKGRKNTLKCHRQQKYMYIRLSEEHLMTVFQVFILVVVYGLWHGLCFLPVVLAIIGPTPYYNAGPEGTITSAFSPTREQVKSIIKYFHFFIMYKMNCYGLILLLLFQVNGLMPQVAFYLR